MHITLSEIKTWVGVEEKTRKSISYEIRKGQKISCIIARNCAFKVEFIPEFYLLKEGEAPYLLKDYFKH